MVKKNISKGVLWSAIERFASQGIQFVVSVIVARLLNPDDYGLIAMAMVLIAILQVITETGFAEALMRKLDRDDLDYSTVFVSNIVLGLFCYCILYILAPFISIFFDEPQLTIVYRLLGLILIVNSFIIVQRTILFLALELNILAKSSVFAALLSGVISVVLASTGFGVFSLVVQSIIYNLVNAIIISRVVCYKPSFEFSMSRFSSLFKFAYNLILMRLLNVVFNEGFSLVLGKLYSASFLGYYNRAASFQAIGAKNISQIIQRVSTPILCDNQRDSFLLKQSLLKFLKMTLFFVVPLSVGIFVLAEALVITLLTEKWLYTASVLKYIAPIGVFYVYNTFNRNLFNATGRTDLALKSEIIKKILFVLIVVISLDHGFEMVMIGLLLAEIFDFLISAYYTKRQIDLSIWEQLWICRDIFSASIIMAIGINLSILYIYNDGLRLIVGFFVGIVIYFIASLSLDILNLRGMLVELLYNHKLK